MRINIYSQELLLDEPIERAVQLVEQDADTGITYCGVRLYLKSADALHDRDDDDDRSAITFWLPRSIKNRAALAGLLAEMQSLIILAPKETGLD